MWEFTTRSLVFPTSNDDIPLAGNRERGLDELTIKEIRRGLRDHRFTMAELESLVSLLIYRIRVYLDNKFITC